jgi:hypothetical protein
MKTPKKRREMLAETMTIRLPSSVKDQVDTLKGSGVNCQEWIRNLIEKELKKMKFTGE